MKRFSLSSRRRKLIAAGGILAASIVLASAFLVGSGADFTSKSANPGNVFTAGEMTQSNSNDNAAILTAELMKPGDVVTGDVTIENTGDFAGVFTLSMVTLDSAVGAHGGYLFDVLKLKIDEGATEVWSGNLKDFSSVLLGTWAATGPTASHTYTFTVTFPDGGEPDDEVSGDNIYQGSSTTVEFDWTAVQS